MNDRSHKVSRKPTLRTGVAAGAASSPVQSSRESSVLNNPIYTPSTSSGDNPLFN